MRTLVRQDARTGLRLWRETTPLGDVYSIDADPPRALPYQFMPVDAGDLLHNQRQFDLIVDALSEKSA